MRAWILPLLALVLLPPSTSAQSDRPPAFAFEGVTIVPMDSPRALPDHTVLISGDRIAWIGPRSRASLPPGTQRIGGQRRFLLPGLVDVHVHVTPEDFPLFLANGVTTVREMNGSPDHLAWRDEVRRGVRVGPTLYVASPLLAGVRQGWRHTLVTSDTAAVRIVNQYAAAGYDLIKVYDGLSPEVYRAIVAEAARVGLPSGGHGGSASSRRSARSRELASRGSQL